MWQIAVKSNAVHFTEDEVKARHVYRLLVRHNEADNRYINRGKRKGFNER
jgi:hypothetical protein